MIATAVSDREFEEKLKKYLQTQISSTFVIRFEPSINRALEYALADGFIAQQANGTYKLMDRGKALVKEILNDDTLFQREKDVLEEIQCDLTEEKILRLKLLLQIRFINLTNVLAVVLISLQVTTIQEEKVRFLSQSITVLGSKRLSVD